jgi:hypothetical protein
VYTVKALPRPRYLGAALLAWAAGVLLVAFAAICQRTGSAWPWSRVVHEDGERTLMLTILYFEHAARELPLDVLLGIAVGGAAFFAFAPTARTGVRLANRSAIGLGSLAAIVIAVIAGGTVLEGGMQMLIDNILQNHTRPGTPLEWGSHWRYHLLERLALMLISLGFGGLARLVADGGGTVGRTGLAIVTVCIGVYLALTVVFWGGPAAFSQSFVDARYLGHQARELFTHALVTVPVAWAVCMLTLPPSTGWVQGGRAAVESGRASPQVAVAIAAGGLGLTLGAYTCFAALASDAISHGQTTDVAMLIFPHFFEHSFTYLLVPIVSLLVYKAAAQVSSATSREIVAAGTDNREPGWTGKEP